MEGLLYPSTNTSRTSSLRKKRGIISALGMKGTNGEDGEEAKKRERKKEPRRT